jgi:hypothetical protein
MAKADKTNVDVLARSPSHLLHRALQLALDVYGERASTSTFVLSALAIEISP